MTCTQRRSNSFTSSPERLFCDHIASTLISDCITGRQAGNSFFFSLPLRWSEKKRRKRGRNKPNGNAASRNLNGVSQTPVISKSAEALSTLNDNYWDLEYDGAQTNFTLITHNAIASKLVVPLHRKHCSKERKDDRKRKENVSVSARTLSAEVLK